PLLRHLRSRQAIPEKTRAGTRYRGLLRDTQRGVQGMRARPRARTYISGRDAGSSLSYIASNVPTRPASPRARSSQAADRTNGARRRHQAPIRGQNTSKVREYRSLASIAREVPRFIRSAAENYLVRQAIL